MTKKLLLASLTIFLLAPWPVAYAYDDGAVREPVRIEAADASAAPQWQAFGRAIGGVTTPGDLFYIDAIDSPMDISATLYMTNTDELAHCYRYLTLKVGVYAKTSSDGWEKITAGSGDPLPETYITMRNAMVSFNLPGCASYKVTIDDGCFYCLSASAGEGSTSPNFYLTLE